MNVVDAFRQWYGQLGPNDQQALCAFLAQWLGAQPSTQAKTSLKFGGRTTGPLTASTYGGQRTFRCKRCGAENEV